MAAQVQVRRRRGSHECGGRLGYVIELPDRVRGFALDLYVRVPERPGQRVERTGRVQVAERAGAFPPHLRVGIVQEQPFERPDCGPLVQLAECAHRRPPHRIIPIGERADQRRSPAPAAKAALSRIRGDGLSSKPRSTAADTVLLPRSFAATRRTHGLSVPSVPTRSATARGSVMVPAKESFAPWMPVGASLKRPSRAGSAPIQKLPSWSPIRSQITGSVRAKAERSVATRAESAPARPPPGPASEVV